MNRKGPSTDDRFASLVSSLNFSTLTGGKIILWLVAITVVSFAIGFGILAATGALPSSSGHRGPFLVSGSAAAENITAFSLDGATAGTVRITMGAGDLTVRGGAPAGSLMETTIFSPAKEWQPEYTRSMDGTVMTIAMTDPGHTGKEWFSIDSPNSWDVSLSQDVPLDLVVKFGAGDCTLTLGTLDLTGLSLDAGAGDVTVDLRGYRGSAFTGRIDHGVGDLHVLVPVKSNTRIVVNQGIGDIDDSGLGKNRSEYTTLGFDPARPVTAIIIDQGIGDIRLEAVA